MSIDNFTLGEEWLLTAPAFWSRPRAERLDAYAWLRHNMPVSFHPEVVTPWSPDGGPGMWAVMRYEDVREVTRNPEVFSNAQGTQTEYWPEGRVKALGMLHMDNPEHRWYRSIVGPAFTPRSLDGLMDSMRDNANLVIDSLLEGPDADVTLKLVNTYPINIIAAMLSLPPEDYPQFVEWTRLAFGTDRVKGNAAHGALIEYGTNLAAERRSNPGNDVLSRILTADVEGRPLTDLEVGGFISLLIGAGAETTGSTLAHGLFELARHPDQWEMLKADPTLIPQAVDEFSRWGSAVTNFRRTTTQDTEIAGQAIKAGDKVVIFYESANFDETVFPNPNDFDITRDASKQTSFGVGGQHQCLGEHLGKREMRVFMEEMIRRVDRMEVTTELFCAPNHRFNMVKELRMTFVPKS